MFPISNIDVPVFNVNVIPKVVIINSWEIVFKTFFKQLLLYIFLELKTSVKTSKI